MKLKHDIHLAYCTNVHRGETWPEIFGALKTYTLAVRDRVGANAPFAIGLRLSNHASIELANAHTLSSFRRWLDQNNCYVFTINGFPFGQFHSVRVKEQVYWPDWTSPERLEYTNRLFDILAELVPAGVDGSVSTLPGSFKSFITGAEQVAAMQENLWLCMDHICKLSEITGRNLHLGLEPEPLGFFENTQETVQFFSSLRNCRSGDDRINEYIGVNYDTCHFAVEYEEPGASMRFFEKNGIKISKLHLSSALGVKPDASTRRKMRQFDDEVYLHQVIARCANNKLVRFKDLPMALAANEDAEEWRVHFHIPLYAVPESGLGTTSDHLIGALDELALNPSMCSHLEMETYTWDVLPKELRAVDLVEQLAREYEWTLAKLHERGLA